MKITRILLLILLAGIILYQQSMLKQSYAYNDMVYKAFKTCISTQAQMQGVDAI